MDKNIIKVLTGSLVIITLFALCSCDAKPTFAKLQSALNGSKEPYYIEASAEYCESGVMLVNKYTLEIGKDNEQIKALYSWQEQELAPLGSEEQIICSSGSDIFFDKNYKSLCKKISGGEQHFKLLSASELAIKKNYFLKYEFKQEKNTDYYYFYGELNSAGRKMAFGGAEKEIVKADIEIKVLGKEKKVLGIVVNFQYSGGGEGRITFLYGYDMQKI